jgi:hypothetical protein
MTGHSMDAGHRMDGHDSSLEPLHKLLRSADCTPAVLGILIYYQ